MIELKNKIVDYGGTILSRRRNILKGFYRSRYHGKIFRLLKE